MEEMNDDRFYRIIVRNATSTDLQVAGRIVAADGEEPLVVVLGLLRIFQDNRWIPQ